MEPIDKRPCLGCLQLPKGLNPGRLKRCLKYIQHCPDTRISHEMSSGSSNSRPWLWSSPHWRSTWWETLLWSHTKWAVIIINWSQLSVISDSNIGTHDDVDSCLGKISSMAWDDRQKEKINERGGLNRSACQIDRFIKPFLLPLLLLLLYSWSINISKTNFMSNF